MSDTFYSPIKRRKTKGALVMKNTKVAKVTKPVQEATSELLPFAYVTESMTDQALVPSWPLHLIPVELFTLIASYLPRSNIQNMRLVNREFDLKVSEALFRTVVVPFRPEIYGITPETTSSNELLQGQGSVMIQDKGMRVFQGYVVIFYYEIGIVAKNFFW